MHSKILILDFGSQVTQLIARRIRMKLDDWNATPVNTSPAVSRSAATTAEPETLADVVSALGGIPRFHKAALIPQTAELLAATEGLVLLRGRWVEVDRAGLSALLARWRRSVPSESM